MDNETSMVKSGGKERPGYFVCRHCGQDTPTIGFLVKGDGTRKITVPVCLDCYYAAKKKMNDPISVD